MEDKTIASSMVFRRRSSRQHERRCMVYMTILLLLRGAASMPSAKANQRIVARASDSIRTRNAEQIDRGQSSSSRSVVTTLLSYMTHDSVPSPPAWVVPPMSRSSSRKPRTQNGRAVAKDTALTTDTPALVAHGRRLQAFAIDTPRPRQLSISPPPSPSPPASPPRSPPTEPPPPTVPTAEVTTAAGLHGALADATVSRIVIASGHYALSAQLSVSRSVTIEAATPRTVVLDAQGSVSTPRRVIDVSPSSSSDIVQLIGLDVTGGFLASGLPGAGIRISQGQVILHQVRIYSNEISPALMSSNAQGGGVGITAVGCTVAACTNVTFDTCEIYNNAVGSIASQSNSNRGHGGGVYMQSPVQCYEYSRCAGVHATFLSTIIHSNNAKSYGAGVYIGHSVVHFHSSEIRGNGGTRPGWHPNSQSWKFPRYAGGVYQHGNRGRLAMTNTILSGNVAREPGACNEHYPTARASFNVRNASIC